MSSSYRSSINTPTVSSPLRYDDNDSEVLWDTSTLLDVSFTHSPPSRDREPISFLSTSSLSSHAAAPPKISGDITRTLHFYAPPRYQSPPRFILAHPNHTGVKNYGFLPKSIKIQDIRGKEFRFILHQHSFQPIRHLQPLPYLPSVPASSRPSSFIATGQTSTLSSSPSPGGGGGLPTPLEVYKSTIAKIYQQTQDLILRHVSSSYHVVVFTHSHISPSNPIGLPRHSKSLQIPQTPSTALQLAKAHLSATQYDAIIANRVPLRIIYVWRLLPSSSSSSSSSTTTQSGDYAMPLVLGDSSTILDRDLVDVERVHPDPEISAGGMYAVRWAEGQEWWWWSGMTTSEAVMVQVFDSRGRSDEWGRERSVRCAWGNCELRKGGYGGHGGGGRSGRGGGGGGGESLEVGCLVLG